MMQIRNAQMFDKCMNCQRKAVIYIDINATVLKLCPTCKVILAEALFDNDDDESDISIN